MNRRTVNPSISQHAWQWYMEGLVHAPLTTKGITTGAIEVLGDAIAQVTERKNNKRKEMMNGGSGSIVSLNSQTNKAAVVTVPWEYRRSLGCFLDGVFITGPLLHLTYNWLEHAIPSHKGSAWATLMQVLIDEFICDPIDVGIYIIATSIVEGKNVRKRLKEKYWITLIDGMVVSLALCPIQFISFRYLPVETRVLVVNLCDLIWMSIVSYISHAPQEPRVSS